MRITATTVALLLHHAATADKASKAPAKGSKKGKGKSGKGTAAPTGALGTATPTGALGTATPTGALGTATPTGALGTAAPTGVPTEGPTAAPTGALCNNSFNNTSLLKAVADYFSQGCPTEPNCETILQYGVIGGWKTCGVTDMSSLFRDSFANPNPQAADFNESLNNWDVSKVTDMNAMFYGAVAYNQPMNDWDVSKVTNMYSMFYYAAVYNQNLCDWGTKLQPTAEVSTARIEFIVMNCSHGGKIGTESHRANYDCTLRVSVTVLASSAVQSFDIGLLTGC